MKLKYNFVLNQLGEEFVAVPIGDSVIEFNGLLKLNESAAYIIESLNNEITYDDLCMNVAAKFSTTTDDARKNIDYIIDGLMNAGLIVE